MITLLGSLLGFFASAFPELIGFFKARQDNAQELAMYSLQMQAMQIQGSQKMDELVAQGDIASIQAAHTPQQSTGIRWIDGLVGSVRPILTYFFFFLYAGMKAYQIYHTGANLIDTPWLFWTEEDESIFASIICFWFGSRMMEKHRAANQ